MKKLFVVLVSALAAAACAAPTEVTNRAPMSNANMTAETKPAAMITEAEASAKEKASWDAIKNKNYEAFGNDLDTDYVESSLDTLFDKTGIMNAVKDVVITDAAFSEWRLLPIDKDAFVITYKANVKGSYKGEPFSPSPVLASSAWVNRGGKWLAIYHQETESKPMSAMPPPKAEAAKPSPSAAASPVTTGPDPVANEKAVWATLKAKNYDAFASLLAPESLEVEPDGVHDKAGSVKGVSQFDFSKAELSDFKPVTFDEDAKLVSYIVKMPAPNASTERHSTIWVERNGKWLALFHQGTVLPKAKAKPMAGMSPAK